ncbi:hypothetical protein KP509_28G002900 [Ceratopteris richardii]|uniref:Methyltransferase type 12 domain-containing protein n=1 Tax=Ceratopteris richardii TaxID=49495 RepID=A0A8T2RAV3_CERRI|nr:hypothetical protein KP509_28G002900 [Ceratopteris richardii]
MGSNGSLRIYSPPTDHVSEFWRNKYEKDARKYWDLFYKRNSDKFFKDRHYIQKEWGTYFQKLESSSTDELQNDNPNEMPVLLEVGCGVGNTLFPLLETYPKLFVHACDFSARAVSLIKAHKYYDENHIHAFVCDVTNEDLSIYIPAHSVDFATLVFSLSAMSPEKMPQVLQNIKRVLKPNGHVLIRDYAFGDLAQERLSAKVQKISQNFYVRGDGTPYLINLFKEEGYNCEMIRVFEKTVENRAREITMDRRWIQGVFSLMDPQNVSRSIPSIPTMPLSERKSHGVVHSESNEVDLSEDAAMFMGIPGFEVISVTVAGRVFQIKCIPKEFQHSCKATGLMVWESAEVLATLLSMNSSTLASKTVVELGCGSVGICSMVAATTARLVVATDGDSDALALLAENLKMNAESFASTEVFIEPLSWGCEEQMDVVKQRTDMQGFDILLGSDVTYVPAAVPLLFASAKGLIAKAEPGKSEPVLLLCHVERHVNEAFILDCAQKSGFFLQDRWPRDKKGITDIVSSSILASLFPRGLEEAFHMHDIVQLYCFRLEHQDQSVTLSTIN